MDTSTVQPNVPSTQSRPVWLTTLRWYLVISASTNLLWEIGQLPLYTIWYTNTPPQIAFAVAHCTAGDVMIAALALAAALVLVGDAHWPDISFWLVGGAAILAGFAYTVYSEWLNVAVRQTWAYAPAMPVLPPLGIGLSPLLQWLIIPIVALFYARRRGMSTGT